MSETLFIGEITEQGIIPGNISRKIFDAIKSNSSYDEHILQYGVSAEEFENLKVLYQKKLQEIPNTGNYPRYYIFHCILKDKYLDISWKKNQKASGKYNVNFCLPLVDHLQPSLLSLLLDRIVLKNKLHLVDRYPELQDLSKNSLNHIKTFIESTQLVYPSREQMRLFTKWIQKAQEGMPSTIFFLICPDYSVEPTNDPVRPYKHNFECLGNDIGQIAKRIINILPDLKILLRDLNIRPEIISAIADYEAFSKDNVIRMQVSKEEFLDRVAASKLAFNKKCEEILPVQTSMCSDLCGGEIAWLKKIEEIKYNFENNHFGLAPINKQTFFKIANSRKALYRNWFGPKNVQEYIPIAISQAAEYTAIGYNITMLFPNCLVLGADSEMFGPFYSVYKLTPALYFKRFYC